MLRRLSQGNHEVFTADGLVDHRVDVGHLHDGVVLERLLPRIWQADARIQAGQVRDLTLAVRERGLDDAARALLDGQHGRRDGLEAEALALLVQFQRQRTSADGQIEERLVAADSKIAMVQVAEEQVGLLVQVLQQLVAVALFLRQTGTRHELGPLPVRRADAGLHTRGELIDGHRGGRVVDLLAPLLARRVAAEQLTVRQDVVVAFLQQGAELVAAGDGCVVALEQAAQVAKAVGQGVAGHQRFAVSPPENLLPPPPKPANMEEPAPGA